MNQQLQTTAPPIIHKAPATTAPGTKTMRNTIAILFAAMIAAPTLIVMVFRMTTQQRANQPVRIQAGLPKATAKVFALDGMIYLENTTTNVWQGGELIIDPMGERYRIALGSVPPNQLMEFSAADFATLKGDRFPASAKVLRMVSVQPAGMESSVHTLR